MQPEGVLPHACVYYVGMLWTLCREVSGSNGTQRQIHKLHFLITQNSLTDFAKLEALAFPTGFVERVHTELQASR